MAKMPDLDPHLNRSKMHQEVDCEIPIHHGSLQIVEFRLSVWTIVRDTVHIHKVILVSI